ncbi:MAG TPA: RagB/SusD family nutrient uptake outer membrane protein, partial [Ferruginibacter sp.]|nr:RagB/SusD family nutrient uptake outer membrane protein [Ferruginibacter sp.]
TKEAVFFLVNESATNLRFGGLRNNDDTLKSMNLPINAATYQLGTASSADVRKVWYKDSLYASSNSHIYSITKYKRKDFILAVLHITELKLIRAESAASLGTNLAVAIQDINDITNRAYGGTVSPLPGTATASQVLSRVRAERRLELVYENGDRLQQIKRLGALGVASVSHGNAPWNCNGIVLQFPAQEFNVNSSFVPNPTGGCL